MTTAMADVLVEHGCKLVLGERVSGFTETTEDGQRAVNVHTSAGRQYPGQLVILGIGVTPNSQIAKAAGIETGAAPHCAFPCKQMRLHSLDDDGDPQPRLCSGPRGGIRVKDNMQTLTDPDIFAVGDVIEVRGWRRLVAAMQALGWGPAVCDSATVAYPTSLAGDRLGDAGTGAAAARRARQPAGQDRGRRHHGASRGSVPGRSGQEAAPLAALLSASLMVVKHPPVDASQGTAVCGAFGKVAAVTGAAEKTLRRLNRPYSKVYLHPGHHVGYYPGAQPIALKVIFDPETGLILGGQARCPQHSLCCAVHATMDLGRGLPWR